jgi:hypothetical protein
MSSAQVRSAWLLAVRRVDMDASCRRGRINVTKRRDRSGAGTRLGVMSASPFIGFKQPPAVLALPPTPSPVTFAA